MSTVARRTPSKARTQRAIRLPGPGDVETRILFRGVGWEVYDTLSDSLGEGSHVRMIYDGRDLEIKTTSNLHDFLNHILGLFVHEVATEMRIQVLSTAQATWKRPEIERA